MAKETSQTIEKAIEQIAAVDPVAGMKTIHKVSATAAAPSTTGEEPHNAGMREPEDLHSERDVEVEIHKRIVAGRKHEIPALERRLKELREERRQRELGLR